MFGSRTSKSFSSEERNILLVVCPTHFLCHFYILVFPAVTIPMMATFGLALEDVVKLSFMMYLVYGLGALPAGMLVDRWQAKGMLVIGQFLMGAGLILAGSFPKPHLLGPVLCLVGAGASIYHPAGLALISRTVGQRGLAMGINGVFGNLGIAAAPLATGVLTWLYSWQTAFVIMGVTGVVAGFLIALIPVNESIERKSAKITADGNEMVRYFLLLCAAMVFAGIAYRGNMLLLPAYFELNTTFFHRIISSLSFIELQGTTTLAATVLTSFVLLAGIFGQMLGGKVADRIDLRRAYLLVHTCSLPFILAMAFTSEYALALCAALYVFFGLGMQPIENSLIAALTPQRWRSTTYAIKFILNFAVGSTVVYAIGPVKNAFSLGTVYVFLAGVTALLVVCTVAIMVVSRRIPAIRN